MTAEPNACGHPKGREMAGAAIANTVVLWQSPTPRIWAFSRLLRNRGFPASQVERAFRGLNKELNDD